MSSISRWLPASDPRPDHPRSSSAENQDHGELRFARDCEFGGCAPAGSDPLQETIDLLNRPVGLIQRPAIEEPGLDRAAAAKPFLREDACDDLFAGAQSPDGASMDRSEFFDSCQRRV